MRFLAEQKNDCHVTDIDILILPKKVSHTEYYKQYLHNGASYVRGALYAKDRDWVAEHARIAGGHVYLTKEYYDKTRDLRSGYLNNEFEEKFREFDEVLLQNLLSSYGCIIPKKPYHFPCGTEWDKDYRDLHLGDFRSQAYLKWMPNKMQVLELFNETEFILAAKNAAKPFKELIKSAYKYAIS